MALKRKIDFFSSQTSLVKGYFIGHTLGIGSYGTVKLGKHKDSGQCVALKFISKEMGLSSRDKELIYREVTAMRTLSHKNILQLLDVDLITNDIDGSGKPSKTILLIVELAVNRQISDYLTYTGAFTEIQARTYFKSLIIALEYCHSQGIYHRDLKPQNLLLDADFQLKIADFGLASVSLQNTPETLLTTRCGSLPFTAPEVLQKNPKYKGSQIDIWSAGVILFIMLTGDQPPFQVAIRKDYWFNEIANKRYDRFWAAHLRTVPDFPPGVQDLLNSIFVVEPEERATIEQIKNHQWFQRETLETTQLALQFEKRLQDAIRKQQKLRAEMEKIKRRRMFKSSSSRRIHLKNTHRSMILPCELNPAIPQYELLYTSKSFSEALDWIISTIQKFDGELIMQNTAKFLVHALFSMPALTPHNTHVGKNTLLNTIEQQNGLKLVDKVQVSFCVYNDKEVCTIHFQRKSGSIFAFKKLRYLFEDKLYQKTGNKTKMENSTPRPVSFQSSLIWEVIGTLFGMLFFLLFPPFSSEIQEIQSRESSSINSYIDDPKPAAPKDSTSNEDTFDLDGENLITDDVDLI